jgi:hypothetical protein
MVIVGSQRWVLGPDGKSYFRYIKTGKEVESQSRNTINAMAATLSLGSSEVRKYRSEECNRKSQSGWLLS